MKKKIIISLVCFAIVGFIAYKLVANKKEINQKNQPAKVEDIHIPVTTVMVREGIQEAGLVKNGMLTPFQEAKVLSASTGTVKRLMFKLGDKVSQGQILAVIDTRLLELDLQKSESNVAKLKRDLQTYTELLEGNAATQEKVNDIRQTYNESLNLSAQLRNQIMDAKIKAPTNGIIASKTIVEGMFLSNGAEIASIVNLSSLKVQLYLTEAEIYQVVPGQDVKLTTDVYPDRLFTGKVTFISPQANQAYNYQVEITAANQKDAPLRSGTFVYADFSKKTNQKILIIPREALNASVQDASVYVVNKDRAVLRSIKVGKEYGGNIQVNAGLKLGEQVITSGQINLMDGTLINISK
ncbi:MAG: efflux RND transporter periplasmic adaptor subunit [Chitinophagaceae bacterium]|nr:MAG: efflux RND transporter periplasmic adaptor subunit [Chitinophagaceae bacterium]